MEQLIKIVKEEGVAQMIMDMKHKMEHVEKFNIVLDELKQRVENIKIHCEYVYEIDEYNGQYDEIFSVYNRLDMVVTNITKELYLNRTTDENGEIDEDEDFVINSENTFFTYITEDLYMEYDVDDGDLDDVEDELLQTIIDNIDGHVEQEQE